MLINQKQLSITAEQALPDRLEEIIPAEAHAVNGSMLSKEDTCSPSSNFLGMGCFWGAERLFWKLDGVTSTSVGYSGGFTMNPTYRDVCSAQTGHTEVVQVVFDPERIPLEEF